MPLAHLLARGLHHTIEGVEERGGGIPCKNIIFVVGDLPSIGMKGGSRRWSSSYTPSVAPSAAPSVAPSAVPSFDPFFSSSFAPSVATSFFLEGGHCPVY